MIIKAFFKNTKLAEFSEVVFLAVGQECLKNFSTDMGFIPQIKLQTAKAILQHCFYNKLTLITKRIRIIFFF